jgi:hypothetical protein
MNDVITDIDGENAIQTAFKELRAKGYAKLVTKYDYDLKRAIGKFYDIYENKEECSQAPSVVYYSNGKEIEKPSREPQNLTVCFPNSLQTLESENGVLSNNIDNKRIKNKKKEKEEKTFTFSENSEFKKIGSRIVYGVFDTEDSTGIVACEKRIVLTESIHEAYLLIEPKCEEFIRTKHEGHYLALKRKCDSITIPQLIKHFFSISDMKNYSGIEHLHNALFKCYDIMIEKAEKGFKKEVVGKAYEIPQGITPTTQDKDDVKKLYKTGKKAS